mgnify:CR=1 FL=1|jgi:uncharacterized Zn-binding protein involved in type VI secretion
MPNVARGSSRDSVITQHGCASTTTTRDFSPNVIVNTIGVHRHGDYNTSHTIRKGDSCRSHSKPIQSASTNVFANNKGVARVGDPYSGCGKVLTGSLNVFANGA